MKNLEVYLTQYNWTSHQIKTLIKISNEFYISTQLLKEHNLEINDYTKYNNLLRYLTVKVKKFDLDTNYFSKNEDIEKTDKKDKIKN